MNQVHLIQMTILIKYNWVIIFLPLLIGIYSFRTFQKGTKYLFYFVVFGTFVEIITHAGLYWFDFIQNSLPVGHIYIPISFLLAGMFYLNELIGLVNKKVIIAIIILFELFALINALVLQGIYSFASYSGAIGALILIFFSILLYAKIMAEAKIKRLHDSPVIWLNSAILIYYTANFFFYILFNIILNNSVEFVKQTILIFKIFNTIFYLLIAIGFLKVRKQLHKYSHN